MHPLIVTIIASVLLYQGHGKSLWYMQGMFRANGGCGYVKKPAFLMERGHHNELFDPKRSLPAKKTLKVRIEILF